MNEEDAAMIKQIKAAVKTRSKKINDVSNSHRESE